MRVAFTGSICVGKSTLAKAVAKHLKEHKLSIDLGLRVPGDRKTLNWAKSALLEYFSVFQHENVVADRFFTDFLAFRYVFQAEEPLWYTLVAYAEAGLEIFKERAFVFYLPPEIPFDSRNRDDRSEELRAKLDKAVIDVLEYYQVPFTTIKGSIAQRTSKVLAKLFEAAKA